MKRTNIANRIIHEAKKSNKLYTAIYNCLFSMCTEKRFNELIKSINDPDV